MSGSPQNSRGKEASSDGFKIPSLPPSRKTAATAAQPPASRSMPPLNYTPPSNASAPRRQYTLDVIKEGSVVESHSVAKDKSYFVFGRLPVCDYPMDHASVSRYHAVLQFTDNGNVLSVVDLDSSHGTFVNKKQVLARIPHQLDIGDQIRFGMSSRVWIIGTTDAEYIEQREEERHKEMQEKILERAQRTEISFKPRTSPSRGDKDIRESLQRVTWGMADEDSSKAEYASDPVNSLKAFLKENDFDFGIELVGIDEADAHGDDGFNKKESAQCYTARVALPLADEDGCPLFGAASASSRSEAERLACLDAMDELERRGYLHKEKIEKTKRGISGEDSGDADADADADDDDDYYYDRTRSSSGQGAHKRQPAVETFETLTEKLAKANSEINNVESAMLAADTSKIEPNSKGFSEDADELDAYMDSLAHSEKEDAKKQLAERLQSLAKEKARVEALLRIVAPDYNIRTCTELKSKPIAGVSKVHDVPIPHSINNDPTATATATATETETATATATTAGTKRRMVYGPTREDFDKQAEPSKKRVASQTDEIKGKETDWQPPAGQSGDGRTCLNDKYGY